MAGHIIRGVYKGSPGVTVCVDAMTVFPPYPSSKYVCVNEAAINRSWFKHYFGDFIGYVRARALLISDVRISLRKYLHDNK